jgi:hypothetical protein
MVDQGNANGQWRYGACLRDGIETLIGLQGTTHYFKQRYTECLSDDIGI